MNAVMMETPIGLLALEEESGFLVHIYFLKEIPADLSFNETPVLSETKKQLNEYFLGKRTVFHLPIRFDGTEFQKKIWQTLMMIPYGTVISYKDLAEKAGYPKAYRAAGMANHHNPLPIVIPCHRVIQSDGSLGGYAGGVLIKQILIDGEKKSQG